MQPFTIKEYETGWDKGWNNYNGLLTIETHAPSKVVLIAARDGSVEVEAKVKEGGRADATAFVSNRQIDYGQKRRVRVKAGAPLCLEARLEGSKDHCWNYWEIASAAIVLPESVSVSYWEGAHLGDSLGMLVAVENFARANQRIIRVRETPLFRDIFDLFQFDHLVLAEADETTVHVHPFGHDFEHLGWIGGMCRALQFAVGGEYPAQITIPPLRRPLPVAREDVVLVQFDSRSGGRWTPDAIKTFLSRYSPEKVAVVGGPDTEKYLGNTLEYRTGNLAYIASQLLSCKKYAGVDSGIAHLACMLGLKIDLVPSPTVSPALVRGIFGSYSQTPNYLHRAEVKKKPRGRNKLFLVSTTNGWNLGDDLIRQGVFRLLDIKPEDPIVWLNRCQVASEDRDRHCSWSPLWKRLRNFGDPSKLAALAKAFIVAGTPEWIDTVQPYYKLAAELGIPIWMVGVGGSQMGQLHHLSGPHEEGVLNCATVRDEAARCAIESCGIAARRFMDPAFHSNAYERARPDRIIFNPRLQTPHDRVFYMDLYARLRGRIDLVTVHEPDEYAHACSMFEHPVLYNSDYRVYMDIYRTCLIYVGGRMHGAIPSLASGAEVHLVCHEGKHRECSWLKSKLNHPEALTLWEPRIGTDIRPQKRHSRFDNKPAILSDFEEHRSYLQQNIRNT